MPLFDIIYDEPQGARWTVARAIEADDEYDALEQFEEQFRNERGMTDDTFEQDGAVYCLDYLGTDPPILEVSMLAPSVEQRRWMAQDEGVNLDDEAAVQAAVERVLELWGSEYGWSYYPYPHEPERQW